jgi:cytochrome c-type biogenesis protein CcmH
VLVWFVLALLTAIVLFVLLRPLMVARDEARVAESFDAAVYRDQLNEIESDRARGLIGETEAEAARVEIARRLLAADEKARDADRTKTTGGIAKAAILMVGAALPLLSLGLYLTYGSPRLPDQPLAARLQDPANEQSIEALVAKVEARLRENPEEGEGWEAIAPIYLRWGRYNEAAEAYARALALLGPSAKLLSGQGQAIVLANDGLVTPQARSVLEEALKRDGTLIEPRILIAIAKEQDGQFNEAVEDWRRSSPMPRAMSPGARWSRSECKRPRRTLPARRSPPNPRRRPPADKTAKAGRHPPISPPRKPWTPPNARRWSSKWCSASPSASKRAAGPLPIGSGSCAPILCLSGGTTR